ncbi:Golgi-associated kinase 1B [Nothobranchius furzeri]|uniref:Family with sequence similarity 198 member B n=6 Tax=Nothobranchius TaxID=28779 RepID=A0A1A8ART6_NOTFU|nr:Golgi-associated kinase 1B [Nothobranchius furzeri]KAF7228617.1 family with sequence similarity 198 member B [Nothobranchius furzeri]
MGNARAHWLFFSFLKLASNFRRCSLFKRSLFITAVCAVYLFFVIPQVGTSLRHQRRTDEDETRHTRGLDISGALPHATGLQTGASLVQPTRTNVVYISLKSKRLKPAKIRCTIRPKRRKKRGRKTPDASVTHSKLGTVGRYTGHTGNFTAETSWNRTSHLNYELRNIINKGYAGGSASQVSSIRIYSQTAPPWLSSQDLETMRFLADSKILRFKEIYREGASSLLMFEGEVRTHPTNQKLLERNNAYGRRCGIIHSPTDNTEVFAFHLDRVLGLNRTLPAVSRKFSFFHDGQFFTVVSWDASLYPEDLAAGPVTVRLTWREYQNSLVQRCWHKNTRPKPDSGCSTIHHYEWSKLALFDFLLQIHNRLDQSCCGFRPRREDVCVEVAQQASCEDQENVKLANIFHRNQDSRHLVFTNNKGFFDRNEDNLDFRLLEGIREFPEKAVTVLKSRKLREKLLQSLFLDQMYWESQGGRQGIDKLIDVIERRAKVLLTYIMAHGIKVITMND